MATSISPERTAVLCAHQWEYFVDVSTRKVANRVCAICGAREAMGAAAAEEERHGRLSA